VGTRGFELRRRQLLRLVMVELRLLVRPNKVHGGLVVPIEGSVRELHPSGVFMLVYAVNMGMGAAIAQSRGGCDGPFAVIVLEQVGEHVPAAARLRVMLMMLLLVLLKV
jgi:hypothetical protein